MEEVYEWFSPNQDAEFPVYYYARKNNELVSGIAAFVYYSTRYINGPSWRWVILKQFNEGTELKGSEEYVELAMLRVEIALGVMPVVYPSSYMKDTILTENLAYGYTIKVFKNE